VSHISQVRALISGEGLQPGENKVEVNARDINGATALHYACDSNALAVARVLIEHFCDVNAADLRGRLPLHLAASAEEEEEVVMPVESMGHDVALHRRGGIGGRGDGGGRRGQGGEGDGKEEEGEDEARAREEEEGGQIVKLLIEQRAWINSRDAAGWTALHWCVAVCCSVL